MFGCSTIDVKDSDRTNNKAFNGKWNGDFELVPEIQITYDNDGNSYQFYCDNDVVGVNATASNGIIQGELYLPATLTFSSNINDNGRIYVEIPRGSEYLVDGRSRFGGREYHVISGALDPDSGIGKIVYTSAFGMESQGGCKYPVTLKRQKAIQ